MAMCYDDSIGETRPFRYQVDAWLCSIQVVWRVVGGSGHCGEPSSALARQWSILILRQVHSAACCLSMFPSLSFSLSLTLRGLAQTSQHSSLA